MSSYKQTKKDSTYKQSRDREQKKPEPPKTKIINEGAFFKKDFIREDKSK